MVIVKLISGLGNQLFQYAIGRQLSLRLGVPLKLDLSFFEGQHLRSFKLGHYNIKAEVATQEEVKKFLAVYQADSLYAKLYRKAEHLLPKHRKRYFPEEEWWVYEPEWDKITDNVYLEGYWQHYGYFQNLDSRVREELTVKEPYGDRILALGHEMERQPAAVAVHVRRGDYLTDVHAASLFGALPLAYYRRAITLVSEKVKDPSFFVFSDDLQWAKANLTFEAPVKFVEVDGGKKDYLELELMSICQHNIIANSSFSWWGAFLNRNPAKIVVAPAQWVVPEEINNKITLQFPGWIKL